MPASARCFDDDKLLENARALADAIQRAKPSGAKGTYVQKVSRQFHDGPRRARRRRLAGGIAGSGRNGAAAEILSLISCRTTT